MTEQGGLDLSVSFPFNLGNVAIAPWTIAEGFLVAALLVYCCYSTLVVWQVYIMSETITTTVSPYLKIFAWCHLVSALSLFAFVVLYWI